MFHRQQRHRSSHCRGDDSDNDKDQLILAAALDKHKSSRREKPQQHRARLIVLLVGLLLGCCIVSYHVFQQALHQTDKARKLSLKRIIYLFGDDFLEKKDSSKSSSLVSADEHNSQQRYSETQEKLFENPMESFETNECKAAKEWQLESFPTCNPMHELNMETMTYVASGGQVNVWKYVHYNNNKHGEATNTTLAVKTMQMRYRWIMSQVSKWRVDSLVLERLSSSAHVADIFGYCGTAGLYEFSYHPNLSDQINWQRRTDVGYPGNIDTAQLLRIAADVARGVADLHTFDGDNYATAGHGDLAWDQFLYQNGVYKLNDFNRAYFLRRNRKLNSTCAARLHPRDDLTRWLAPEEYRLHERTEKADVFSLGHTLYSILTGLEVWEGTSSKNGTIARMVLNGERPIIPQEFLSSGDPAHAALVAAMKKCWVEDPTERASATEVAMDLSEALEKIEKAQNSTDTLRWVGRSWSLRVIAA